MDKAFITGVITTIAVFLVIVGGMMAGSYFRPLPIAEASGQEMGGTTYAGRTTLTFNGNLGGIHGANTKCQVDYPNSHICSQGELLASGVTSLPGSAWGVCDHMSATNACLGVTDTQSDVTGNLCAGYTISTAGQKGVSYDAAGTMVTSDCNTPSLSIHCCI